MSSARDYGLAGATIAAGCLVVWWANPMVPGGVIPVCPSVALCGITCPLCGCSRMVYSLLHGEFMQAWKFNALAMCALIALVWLGVARLINPLLTRAGWPVLPRWDRWKYWGILAGGAAVLWLIVRNIPIEPFTATHI